MALQDAGSHMLLCDAQNDVVIEAERVGSLLERRVDGLVISPVHQVESEAVARRAMEFVPVVRASTTPCSDAYPSRPRRRVVRRGVR